MTSDLISREAVLKVLDDILAKACDASKMIPIIDIAVEIVIAAAKDAIRSLPVGVAEQEKRLLMDMHEYDRTT